MTLTLNLDNITQRRLSSYSRREKLSEAKAVQILLQMALDRELETKCTPVGSKSVYPKEVIVGPCVKALSNVPSVQDDSDYKDSFVALTENKYV
ncbi:MAG: hypothetical protein IJV06_06495 [Bacteroidaceae bacterium]|nr:hypothetical protein [Bacteroidaceae bacterium]